MEYVRGRRLSLASVELAKAGEFLTSHWTTDLKRRAALPKHSARRSATARRNTRSE
nr:hypothetical protein [Paenibacillus sp. NFR01]